MEKAFTSFADLRTEIDLLKIKQFHQEELLKETLTDPAAIYHTITSHFKSKQPSSNKSTLQGLLQSDIVTNITRFALPLLLNTTFFKRSGFITKTLVTFLSQKAASKVNTSLFSGITDKVKGFFAHRKQERIQKEYAKDYGIPPDTEAY
ncbi:hypothetical protein [Rubrolithibacter danxiaensis]|uniref:hypothetical protein n=1 Tax=Rubrolithibacter danxiaensis TaxID=3390805 RepID=UPI003BF8FD68